MAKQPANPPLFRARFPAWFWWTNGIGGAVLFVVFTVWSFSQIERRPANSTDREPPYVVERSIVASVEAALEHAIDDDRPADHQPSTPHFACTVEEFRAPFRYELLKQSAGELELFGETGMVLIKVRGATHVEHVGIFATKATQGSQQEVDQHAAIAATYLKLCKDGTTPEAIARMISAGNMRVNLRQELNGNGVFIEYKRVVIGDRDLWAMIFWPQRPAEHELMPAALAP